MRMTNFMVNNPCIVLCGNLVILVIFALITMVSGLFELAEIMEMKAYLIFDDPIVMDFFKFEQAEEAFHDQYEEGECEDSDEECMDELADGYYYDYYYYEEADDEEVAPEDQAPLIVEPQRIHSETYFATYLLYEDVQDREYGLLDQELLINIQKLE